MKEKGASPTMKDVAREAGVALGTVSKVFNNLPVGESYRLRVEEAAQRLGYQVNSYARGLKTNKTRTAALILPNLTNPFFAGLAQHVCQALTERDYRMLLALTAWDPEAEQRCVQMVQQNKVDGVIGLTYNPALEIDPRLPYVSIDRKFHPGTPCVASDNFSGGQLAAAKLLELGCKKLLFLRIGSEVSGEPDRRGEGFEAYCRQEGAEYTVVRRDDQDGIESFRPFLEANMKDGRFAFDGIFCVTDVLSFHIQEMLTQLGVRIPEDVQIIGFDGIRNFSTRRLFCSTIVQPVDLLAETCVDFLLREDQGSLPSLVCLPVTYASGGTTRD